MRFSTRQAGLSLVEIAFAMLIFALVITATVYSLRVVKATKLKAFIIQTTHIKTMTDMFRKQYGTYPGDFAYATQRIKGCDASRLCENGNGDQIVASSNSNGCRLPDYDTNDQNFPCTTIFGAGNETAQFWRHLVLAGLLENITLRSRGTPADYKFGASMPRVRMGGGVQIIYNGNTNNLYLKDFTTNRSPLGHYMSYQRDPMLLHRSFEATGDGAISSIDTRMLDLQLDDGSPLTGNFRSTGAWGCGNVLQPSTDSQYENYEQMQCFILYRIDP